MRRPEPGQIFEGRYRIEGVLGEGGFATVYDAVEPELGRRVALKILKPDGPGYNDELRRRFRRELLTLATLRSSHTVRLLTHGESSSGLLYAVFEHLDGQELAELLRDRKRLDGPEVEHVLRQLLDALGEAHRAGLLHRDLKPENIIIEEYLGDPLHAKLIDFGIARPLDDGAPSITKTGELVGTPRYMSPEQLTERPLTAASDLYSLGLIAFEMAVGRDALHGSSWGDQLDRLVSGHVFSVPELERIGPRLHAVITRMSARNVAERYQSAAQVLDALDGRDRRPRPAPQKEAQPARPVALLLLSTAVVALAGGLWATWTADTTPSVSHTSRRAAPAIVRTKASGDDGPAVDAVQVHEKVPEVPRYGSAGCWEEAVARRVSNAEAIEGERVGNGFSRFVPPTDDPGQPAPLIVLLHDSYQGPNEFMMKSGFVAIAQAKGLVVLAPHAPPAVPPLGHAERPWKTPGAMGGVREAVRALTSEVCVDLRRIYVVGHGRGGRATEDLSCDSWLGGTATVSHVPPVPRNRCRREGNEIRPAIRFNPRDSGHHVIFRGSGCNSNKPGTSLTEVDEAWASGYGCETADPPFSKRGKGLECRTWTCDGSVPVKSCLLDGGHPWPGFPPRSDRENPHGCDGGSLVADDLAAQIWAFFEAAPIREID